MGTNIYHVLITQIQLHPLPLPSHPLSGKREGELQTVLTTNQLPARKNYLTPTLMASLQLSSGAAQGCPSAAEGSDPHSHLTPAPSTHTVLNLLPVLCRHEQGGGMGSKPEGGWQKQALKG